MDFEDFLPLWSVQNSTSLHCYGRARQRARFFVTMQGVDQIKGSCGVAIMIARLASLGNDRRIASSPNTCANNCIITATGCNLLCG